MIQLEWRKAVEEEMKALMKNGTLESCPLPLGKKVIGCKWVLTIKVKANGEIERCKVRLVAKGYTQTQSIYYQETFALVAKMKTTRVLLSLAAHHDWPLHLSDVKNTFLHGDLK